MPINPISILVLLPLILILHGTGVAQTPSRNLHFRTAHGLTVTVNHGFIFVNNRPRLEVAENKIIYRSKRNRILENGGSSFLFLEFDGSPNRNRLHVFQIFPDHVDLVADAISSDLKDVDGDTYLEFGGSNLTEGYPSRDSMYYIPYQYYEVRNGRITLDSACSRKMETKVNGVYRTHILNEYGNCCVVVPIPSDEKTYIAMDTHIGSERIDGPANILDTIGGSLLFQLDDNVPVATSDTANNWWRIGVAIDLDSAEYRTSRIQKGSKLYAQGVPVGAALETLKLQRVFLQEEKLKGELEGYTSLNNIKPGTIPEKVISRVLRQRRSFDVMDLSDFMAAFHFNLSFKNHYPNLPGYCLDEGAVDTARPIRLFLAFDGRSLMAVAHRRKLDKTGLKEISLLGGYSLTVLADQDPRKVGEFIQQFNNYLTKGR